MTLTTEQLRASIRGAVVIEEENGLLRPYRFTKEKRDFVYRKGNPIGHQAPRSAGITLRFVTDAESVAFSFKLFTHDGLISFDVWSDDLMVFHNTCEEKGKKILEGRFDVALPAGTKTVTIYYPYRAPASIYDVSLPDGATFAPAPMRPRKFYVIGDSITQGFNSTYSSGPFPHALAREFDAEIVNQAIGGEVFNALMLGDPLPFTPDFILLGFGTNDWGHRIPREAFLFHMEEFFRRLRELFPDTKIVEILPIWRKDADTTVTNIGTFEDLRGYIRDAAERHNVTVVDGLTMTPHLAEFYGDDAWLHPNDLGFKFYADSLIRALRPILSE